MPKFRSGKLARTVLHQVGDLDISAADAGHRPRILEGLKGEDLASSRFHGEERLRRVDEAISLVRSKLERFDFEMQDRNRQESSRIEQANLWRSVHIQERYHSVHLEKASHAFALLFVAALDFYIFAQAVAVISDYKVGSAVWWGGGIFGLVVFGLSVPLGRHLKEVVVSRAQVALLAHMDSGGGRDADEVRSKLVELRPAWGQIALLSLVFLGVTIAGIGVRLSGSVQGNVFVIAFQGLIPITVVILELYIFDPMRRSERRPNYRHRRTERRLAKLERRRETIAAKNAIELEKIEHAYGVEQEILAVEQKDLGIDRSGLGENG